MTEKTSQEGTQEEVKVSKSLLEGLQKRLDERDKTINMLMEVSDKKRLALWASRHKEELPPIIKARAMEYTDKQGEKQLKIILGWRTIKDDVYKDALTGRWIERQEVELIYDDGTKEKMQLTDFNRRFVHIQCKRLSVTDKDGDIAFTLERLDNGEQIVVGATFVN